MKTKFFFVVSLFVFVCASVMADTNPYVYTGAGAVIGGVIGNKVGKHNGGQGSGTAIGAAVGGIAGNIYGQRVVAAEQKKKAEEQIASQRAEQQRLENARIAAANERQRNDDDLVARGRGLSDAEVKEMRNRAYSVQQEKMRARQRALDYDQAQRILAQSN
jgi:uncharacterized protein YcfJ